MIDSIEDLHKYLHKAMRIEHATIPPYLTALYSIHPLTNSDATHILRVVAVEEMLHLTLAANIYNAVGGRPDLTGPDFVPEYPANLPDGEDDFQVELRSFSKEALETFLKIERPRKAPDESKRMVPRANRRALTFGGVPDEPGMRFWSIGEFYEEIIRGLKYLGPKIFKPDLSRQVTAEHYYSGGGKLFPVTDLDSAVAAAELIIGQGEGLDHGVYGPDGELAHYYRFEQLKLGQYYQPGDPPHAPSGPTLHVDWEAVYPIKPNARLSDYPDSSELRAAAVIFNKQYAEFLQFLTRAFNGQPELLMDAVPMMFRIRNGMMRLIRNPIPGSAGVNAAPTFEVGRTTVGVSS
jgi:hypothetical protein